MSDLISRKEALDAIMSTEPFVVEINGEQYIGQTTSDVMSVIQNLPSADPLENFEWCTDCKEYDQEKHCCHRWTKVIRQTVEEMQEMGKIAKVIEHDASINTNDGYKYYRTEYICGNCKKKVIGGDEYCSHCGARLEWK